MISPDSRFESTIDDAMYSLFTWAQKTPWIVARLERVRSQTFADVVTWWTRRRRLAMQLRAGGGRSPIWYETIASRQARIDHLAMTGEDA